MDCQSCRHVHKSTEQEPCATCGNSRACWEPEQAPVFITAAAEKPSALNRQVAGDHYKKYKIQPIEFIHGNEIPFMEANVVKYIIRHRDKNGAADVRKAIHYCQLLLELHYGEKN